ncbi:sulfatase [Brevundimonas sp.]|uniref:sulfatase family protein n=1 Tax=Brevundimonas sp. TaxID=1871086 RepID=UPI002AB88F0E|nr:sulfatase-like hydrolase/transferase [Brevundimonas sp.]MDZ4363713.1 sulfatase-like hydrolase/transferase [Brevundimonas sp.]
MARFRRLMAAAAASALLAGPAVAVAQTAPAPTAAVRPATSQPNVIIILADDLGWGDLAIYGHPDIKTPNLDRLAQSGRLLTQFYVGSPVCSPSRASILTGRFAPETGIHYAIGGNAGDRYNSDPWLDDSVTTIYDVFHERGYATGHFGKWHLGARGTNGNAPPPEAYGVDASATTNSSGRRLRVGGDAIGNDRENGSERAMSSAAIVEAGLGFIDQHPGQPFFINLWTLEPHAVLSPTDEQMEPYLDLTHPTAQSRGWRSSQTVYYASVTNVDRAVGQLMEGLEARGLLENTIIIFSSDNGPSPLWSVSTGHAGAGMAGPFRGVKGSLYEGGIRVPFIISWPGQIDAGVIDDTSVMATVDLLPTLTDLAGDPYQAAGLDGENLTPTLVTGPGQARSQPLFWDYRFSSWGGEIHRSPRLAMRDGDWKLLMNPDRSRVELYNLGTDKNETANVAGYESERVAEMSSRLMAWYETEVRDPTNAPDRSGLGTWSWPGSTAPEATPRGRARRERSGE